MTSSSRRILAFVAAGLLCAVAVGVAVWRMSAPESVVAKPSAATAVSSTATTSSSATHSYTTTASPTTTQSKDSHTPVAAPAEDPYLAPNAVVNNTEPAGPTAVYRPDNVSSLQNQQPQATQNVQNPPAPVATTPSTAPSTDPSTASESVAPGSTPQHTEPTPPPATLEPQTAAPQDSAPQESRGEREHNPQLTEQQPTEAPISPQGEDSPKASDSFIPQPAGLAQEAPKPEAEPDSVTEHREPTEAEQKQWDESAQHGNEALEELARESEAHRTNEAPTPAAPTDDLPAAEEPSAETPNAVKPGEKPMEPAAEPAAVLP